ncbi:hypothetical protein [Saccharophagus degradans]|uniref:Lipoprotein n=1 Tax=Saccharophagus degradans TaxID=86304 RepID=A0AAW7X712_9GAMM|nr:hypothetical protein [Saccharophagus degradans]MDO6422293.1 hypothetical protein [Saccharophagus degradans]MDO6607432.1 hypothetical protein [Saccharophagus degradans]
MSKYIFLIISVFVSGCASSPEKKFSSTDVDFMLNDYEEKSFDYPYGEYPVRIIDSIFSRSSELGVKVKGITAMAWGFHPMVYVIYTDNKAYISFFYWGETVGKGYIKDITVREIEDMNEAVYSEESCVPYTSDSIDWVDVHVFKKGDGYIACTEDGAFFGGGKIREYFGKNFEKRIHWVKYSYGK